MAAAVMARPSENKWRMKKCVGAYFANLGLSGRAIEAE
jgi:hypothetical protein